MISTVGNDSANTTCQVLAQDFTGRVSTDTQVLVGVDAATVQYYNITPLQAAYVINYQVANFCPACGPTWSRSAMPHAAVTGRRSEQDH